MLVFLPAVMIIMALKGAGGRRFLVLSHVSTRS